MEKVCVLLSTYNGEQYLNEQIESIMTQKDVDVTILVRDDGSSDNTCDMIDKWADSKDNIYKLEEKYGNNIGVTASFMHLLKEALNIFPDIDYFFFADQDDVWLRRKCERAVSKIKELDSEKALYFSRKILVDSDLNRLKKKDIIVWHNDFFDFFDRSNASGCTMCLTRQYALQILDSKLDALNVLHDAYIYRAALSESIPIVFDNIGTILYRQHDKNVVGAQKRNYLNGIKKVLSKKNNHYIQNFSEYLVKNQFEYIDKNNLKILKKIAVYDSSLSVKISLMIDILKKSNFGLYEKAVFCGSVLLNYF